jgi:MFS transporter, DHA1 family, multidrug resistance protein
MPQRGGTGSARRREARPPAPADAVGGPIAAADRAGGGRVLGVLLTLLVAMGPVSTDLYLPSLPGIAADLGASEAAVQLTIGLFVAGFAATQLVYGPLSDRFGRRPVLLGGIALYTVATVACALAPTIGLLLAARFVQAVGACAGPVIGRAIVRDLYEPREAGRMFGYMASAMALGPLLGPFAGGYLELWFGWRACFVALVLYGGLLLLALALRLEESLPERVPDALRPLALARNAAGLLRDRTFLGYALCVAFAYGALFTWISNASFVVIDLFGVTPERFGWAFAVTALGFIAGAYTGGRTGGRLGPTRTVTVGLAICVTGGTVMAAAGWLGFAGLGVVLAGMTLTFAGCGFVLPQGTAAALAPFAYLAGTASAVVGFIQMTTGVAVNGLSGLFYDGTALPMVTLNAACALAAVLAFVLLVVRRRGGGDGGGGAG